MKYRSPSVQQPVVLKTLIFLPLILILFIYAASAIHSLHKIRTLDLIFDSLLTGIPLSVKEEAFLHSLSFSDLPEYLESWSPSRRDAVHLILGYRGITPAAEGRVSPMTPAPFNELGADGFLIAEAEALVNQDDPEAAEKLLREYWLLHYESSENLPEPEIFDQTRTVILKTNTADFWIEFLSGWSGFLSSGFESAFLLASCYEKTASWEDALFWYDQAGLRSDHWQKLRRTRWYRMRILIRQFPERLPDFLDSVGVLRDDNYFDDILDEFFSVLVRQRRWKEFARILPYLQKAGLTGPASQGLFLLDCGREDGFVTFEDPLLDHFSPDPKGYYALRSSPETWPQILSTETADDSGDASPSVQGSHQASYIDEVYAYLFKAGYQKQAYQLWKADRPSLSIDSVIAFCQYLEGEGDLYELIRFAGFWYYALPMESALRLLPWVFPGSERYTLPDEFVPGELILGIIRRESAFNETISSGAGAGGLMQLMPSTAQELARKYRLDDWDLMKAEDNINLGTLYLQWLQERPWTSSYIDVLAAYNGGGGNLRSWKRHHYYEDPDLFIQSIPFRETRDYVRKVIVAAASYRYLDTGIPPGDWLDQFYSSF
ncbi:lytic transglycosylase domain-containing protein [Oceanispirochaeta sp.]|jgi:hypothetical protein|uniref:flagellar assembly lytic transglycosylase n=1 Tax=Oceanispirochaeta sp. TaxID=2035350 RepID=UPI00260F9F94|nr:lytic transglycosylase domain-containing protein [Oceanispirochaeta sp.]MDA3959120.1 lytic transglycosylase domain-containing protein [Oceanispirochaeta sp.]